jgi:hypothetical protein
VLVDGSEDDPRGTATEAYQGRHSRWPRAAITPTIEATTTCQCRCDGGGGRRAGAVWIVDADVGVEAHEDDGGGGFNLFYG